MNAFFTRFSLLFCLLAMSFAAQAEIPPNQTGITDDEPLPPEQAYPLSTSVTAADMIRAEWNIVDGYYLYREKFKFTSNTPGVTLGEPVFPAGHMKHDEFFGNVETYRGKVAIDIPIVRSNDAKTLDLTIVSQGCADIGLCYPPQKQQVSLTLLPLPGASAPTESSGGPLKALKKIGDTLGLSSNDEEFLPGDKVFIFSAEAESGNTIKAHWDILDGYYLYRDKFKFELKDADGVSIGTITMPPGQEKVDESFGKMVIYHKGVDVLLPLNRTNLKPTDVTLVAKFQGCAERGFCYPPMEQSMPISLPAGTAVAATTSPVTPVKAGNGAMGGAPADDGFVSEQDQLANMIKSGNFLVTLLIFFGSGLLLAFTPCVFPMIPILSSIIAGQGDNMTTRKAFTMSLVYVLAMALTYTVAGVIAGLFGSNLQAAFQNPWILSTFSIVFVGLAFSMFGFYDIQMPSAVQSKLTEISNRQQGGTLTGVAIMGFLSALIVGPCVAAPLMGALIYIGQTGDAVLGGSALFALSMGMGAPLLVIGAAAGKFLPRAGGWMDAVKAVFGVLLLAVAIWMMERVLPEAISMLLWAALLIVSAIYLGALESLPQGVSGWRKLWKGVGLISLIYGGLLLVGVAGGGRDPLQPLQGVLVSSTGGSSQTSVAQHELQFKKIKGLDGLNQALATAKAEGKLAMLDFYADWCVSCKEMEKYTFSDPAVKQSLQNVVLLQTDVTDNDDQDKALLKNFGLVGPPSILFFDQNGVEKRNYRLVGFLSPDKFKTHIEKAKGSSSTGVEQVARDK